jgi:hypothetical protein
MSNIVYLDSYRFPMGSLAYHSDYHVCRILSAKGFQRKITFPEKGKKPLNFVTTTVSVKDLKIITNLKINSF